MPNSEVMPSASFSARSLDEEVEDTLWNATFAPFWASSLAILALLLEFEIMAVFPARERVLGDVVGKSVRDIEVKDYTAGV